MNKYKWLGLTALMPATAMVFAAQGILAVALPTLRTYFGATDAQLWWSINAYLLTSALFLLPGGWFGERIGYRKVFIIGLLIFVFGSALCGLSFNIQWLIGSRALQGIGTALIIPASYPLIMSLFSPDERGKAVGVNMSVSSLFWMISPLLGGFCAQKLSWQWIFGINIPVGLVALALVLRFINHSPQGDPKADSPLIDFSLFRIPLYKAVNISVFVVQFILISAIYRAVFFQDTLGWEPLKSGAVVVASSLPALIAPPFSGWLADRFGAKVPISIGYALLTLSLLLVACCIQAPLEILFIGLIGMSIGTSFVLTPSYTAVMGIISSKRAGTAFAMLATLRALAATLGVIVTSTLITYEQVEMLQTLIQKNHLQDVNASYFKEMFISHPELSRQIKREEVHTFFFIHLAMGLLALISFAIVLCLI